MTRKKVFLLTSILTLIFVFIGYYLFLPALNIKSELLWVLIIATFAFASIVLAILQAFKGSKHIKETKVSFIALALVLGLFLGIKLASSPVFRAKSYSQLIISDIEEHDFEDYSATIGNVPLLDKDSAMKIANRKLGGLEDVISQFEINDTEQITVRGEPLRVASLNHAGLFKWFSNKESGTPGFIKVDMNTQEADLIRVHGGMKYTKSDYFLRNINRYLRLNYPSKIFWESTLELDEEDNPYWVSSILDKTIGLFGGKEVTGAVLVNAVTGTHKQYSLEEIPDWVDNVYGSSLLLGQYDNYGMYQKGFFNSFIGQKGVKRTTAGYNYIPQGDDNWIYTGITSVGKDESNIGFVLMNKRTKASHVYSISGAEEFSAMESAEGAVQHLGYRSTFPLLLKIENQPTYLVALKDSGGLVKMYGMVNVEKYQLVATESNITDTLSEYKKLLRESGVSVSSPDDKEITGIIKEIRTATLDGNSIYFVKLKGRAAYFLLNIGDNPRASILNLEDEIKLIIENLNEDIIPAKLQ